MRVSTINKFLITTLLLVLSSAVYADGSGVGASLASTAVGNHTDVSVAYLSSLFGSVGNVLQGSSGQMLGMMFLVLNKGILVLAGFWLAYTGVSIVMRSAHDGSMMNSPTKYIGLVFLRIALGVAMLVPNPATGYSLLQDGIMKVVVEGVSLADSTWSTGLNYIGAGGSLWHRPEGGTSGSSGLPLTSSQAKNMMTSMTTGILQSEVCMFNANKAANGHATSASNSGVYNSTPNSVNYHPIVDDNAMKVTFPGPGDSETNGSSCGTVSWGKVPGVSSGQASAMIAEGAVTSLVDNLETLARRYSNGTNTDNISSDMSEEIFSSTLNYVNLILPVAQSQASGAKMLAKDFIPLAQKSGWITAGRYYWDISRIQAHYATVSNIDTYIPKVNGPSTNPIPDGSMKDYVGGALNKVNAYENAAGKGDTGADYSNGGLGIKNWVLSMMLGPILGDIVGLITLFATSGVPGGMGPDPIFFLHRIGMHCMNIAGEIYFETGIGLFIATLATMVCQSTLNASTPITAIANWVKPPLMMLATMLLGVGVMLGYYVPLYPFMLFTFGIVSWLIAVIEAMVAAPLVALGLTHPEGHDFLGKAEQALMIVVGVFLRPVLMVIGLIGGMILSYVSLRILVYTYSGFIQDIFYSVAPIPDSSGSILGSAAIGVANIAATSGSVEAIIMSLFAFPIFLVIFASIVYVLVTQCFSLIYVLPDYILRWIGGPQTPNAMSPQQMAQQIGSHLQQGAQKGGELATTADKNKNLDKNLTTEHVEQPGNGDDEDGDGGGNPSITGGGG
ncbi:MAG: DotA/TraY family protein [Gammaproteobacteria bacterium]|nr:DotA/TraY family protein [Gammaproteobacteria bacterium]MCH9744885.1 DotA/TraY family protein [Gammaproteobacteria bacterium]